VELSKEEEEKGDVLFLACSKLLPVDPALPWNTLSVQASAKRTRSETEASEQASKEHGSKSKHAPEMKGDAEASPTRRAAEKRRSESPRPAAIARVSLRPNARTSARRRCCDSPSVEPGGSGTRRRWRWRNGGRRTHVPRWCL
jgi:hypothetical protein